MSQLKIATGLLIIGLSLITTPITAQEYVNCLEIPNTSPYEVMKCQQEQAQRLWNTINAQQQRISTLQQEVTELKPKAAKVPGLSRIINEQQQRITNLQQKVASQQKMLKALEVEINRPNISVNRRPQGLEHNVLFNAHSRYKVSQSGPAPLNLSALFDGVMLPSYSGTAPSFNNPQIITIEGFPSTHTQAGAWFGFTTRFWPVKRFLVEGFQVYGTRPTGWQVIADYSNVDYGDNDFIVKLPHAQYTAFRLSVYASHGSHGKFGISEIFYINPETVSPYDGLMKK